MIRRILAGTLSALCLMLSACTGTRPQEQADTRQVLRVALWDYDETAYDREIIEAFERENPDIRVDVISYRSEIYTSSIQALLESGAQVDVVYINQMAMLTDLMDHGFTMPLDAFVQQSGLDLSRFLYADALRSADGELMALPYRADRFVLYYNRDLFDAAGLAYPDADMTWEEFADTAYKLQSYLEEETETPRYSVFSIYIPTHWSEFLTSAPFAVDTMDLDQLRRGIGMLLDLQERGALVPVSEMRAQLGVQRLFESGNYGMYICGTWLMHYLLIDQLSGDCTMEWGVTTRPHWEGVENTEAAWISALCINRNSTQTDTAWRFIQFVCGKPGAEIMADNLMLPGYWDADISDRLATYQQAYDINTPLRSDSFAPPQPISSAAENNARSAVLDAIGETVLGLHTLDQGMETVQQIQAMYQADSENFVE